ncbi:hypothetical protein CI109_105279 [Kwoniella shandongensis]|uniref:CN hydrolase domain-containing protein n=1 Tax=Kwoniella shandongensis TaxID=1734106 RepID=A0AAJ8MZ81_9TREE
MRIALAQTSPISAPEGPPDLEKPHSTSPFPTLDHNLADAVNFVERAVALNAEVVIFPEYFLQGITNENRQLAKKHNACITGSIVHGTRESGAPLPTVSPFAHIPLHANKPSTSKITPAQLEWAKYLEANPLSAEESSQPTLRNTAFFIDQSGEIKGEYVKRNLWHPEREYLTPGEEEHQVFDTKWGKAGLLICWDISHPAAAQELASQGVDIVFAPTFWYATDSEPLIHNHPHAPDYETSVVSALCLARSFETETVWVMCNAGGDAREGFMGGSGIWAPLRGRIGGCGVEAALEVVDVDLAVLKDARETYKIREDWSKRQAT